MRATLVIVLGFIILFGSAILVSHKVNVTAGIIEESLEQVSTLIETDEWDKASQIINNNYESWQEAKRWWALVVNHNVLNNVEISYQRLNRLVYYQEKSFSLAELDTLITLLKDIPETESLRIINIF
ncbi:MAG: DUF4363 family protein [Peptococcaceae bacterium]|jgi:hypothetical protein|nr:DUF4363 family protein [Peptococcaceae bacterium]